MSMTIELSALGPTLTEQLAAAGYEASGRSGELLDRLAHAITLTHLHGCLTDGECDRARKRLVRQIKVRRMTPNV